MDRGAGEGAGVVGLDECERLREDEVKQGGGEGGFVEAGTTSRENCKGLRSRVEMSFHDTHICMRAGNPRRVVHPRQVIGLSPAAPI